MNNPLAAIQHRSPIGRRQPGAAESEPVVYMVDDAADFQTIVHFWLESHYAHLALKDGNELFGALLVNEPDLIILDLNLPGSDGFELCRRIRATPGRERTPVLFLTASHEYSDYRRNFRAGGTGFLTKPVGRRQLLTAMSELLEGGEGVEADLGGGD